MLLISADDFARTVAVLYGVRGQSGQDRFDPRVEEASEADVQRLRDIANEAPFIRLVNRIIADAVEAKSSDIHIEPGVGRRSGSVPDRRAFAASAVVGFRSTRGRDLAPQDHGELDIAERRMPQDGRIKLPRARASHRLSRLDDLPTVYGESVVMRILDRSRVELNFAEACFRYR